MPAPCLQSPWPNDGGIRPALAPTPSARACRPSAGCGPLLSVVVDTEEQFDWSEPLSRNNTEVTAIRHVERVQHIFDRFGIRPTYVVDYPVASQVDGYLPLREIADDNRCVIGAHLHPWVNPPY